jgi:tryptophan halogenase
MKLCVVGTGAAGWMACSAFKNLEYVNEIVIIGSPNIPSIGVGESNTLKLASFHDRIGINENDFVAKSDASVKYGVLYKNWSKNNFLHNFCSLKIFDSIGISINSFYRSLVNKPFDQSINDYVSPKLCEAVLKNHVCFEDDFYPKSWHFDAGKYIQFLAQHCLADSKVKLINEEVTDCLFCEDKIISVVLSSKTTINADYYVFATGSNTFNETVLKQNYEDLSDILLTDKAFVYPLQYKNQRDEYHPYTIAKTMKYGWRWITPTYSRIGTGYVFSSKYVDEDQACQEFLTDIEDKTISPKLVDFCPRYNKKTFNDNYCTIGMANGFLEPLDAPGLTLTINALEQLDALLFQKVILKENEVLNSSIISANEKMISKYKFWASFILTQYKTCHRNDTEFWIDHKNITYDYQDHILNNLDDYCGEKNNYIMFMHTIAAKDMKWNSSTKSLPYKQLEPNLQTIHHLDYINEIRKSVSRS